MPWIDLERRPKDPDVQEGLTLMGAAVARRRRKLRMSQRELARRSGVHQSSISRFEHGLQFCIRWSRFARLVVVLGGLDFDLDRRDADRPPPPPTWAQLRAASLAEWLAEWQAAEEQIRRDREEEAAEDEAETRRAGGLEGGANPVEPVADAVEPVADAVEPRADAVEPRADAIRGGPGRDGPSIAFDWTTADAGVGTMFTGAESEDTEAQEDVE
jgi:transcriptional regulator with XRE-family HTH domain